MFNLSYFLIPFGKAKGLLNLWFKSKSFKGDVSNNSYLYDIDTVPH